MTFEHDFSKKKKIMMDNQVNLSCFSPVSVRVNPNSLSYPFPLVQRVHVRVRANSGFDRGVGVRGRGRYPLKPSIFVSLRETKEYPEHTAARSSRVFSS